MFKKTLCLSIFLIISFITVGSAGVDYTIEVKSFGQAAKNVRYDFIKQSFDVRLEYNFNQGFINKQSADKLASLSSKYYLKIGEILKKQETLFQEIENYQGDDWLEKFSTTGLWRELKADILNTKIFQFEIDYYSCVSEDEKNRAHAARRAIKDVGDLDAEILAVKLVRAKLAVLSGQSEKAIELIDTMIANSQLGSFADELELQKQSLLLAMGEDVNSVKLNAILTGSQDFEIKAHASFVLSLSGDSNGLLELLKLYSQIRPVLAGFCFRVAESDVSKMNLITAELASFIDAQCDSQVISVFESLVVAGYHSRSIYYVLASCYENQGQTDKAIAMYRNAIANKNVYIKSTVDISNEKLAEHGVSLAYKGFAEKQFSCKRAAEMMGEFFVSGVGISGNLKYYYGQILLDCGDEDGAKKIFQELAGGKYSELARKSRYSLIVLELKKMQGSVNYGDIIAKLEGLVDESRLAGDTEVFDNSLLLYGQIALESQSDVAIKNFVMRSRDANNLDVQALRGCGLCLSGKMIKGVDILADAISQGAEIPSFTGEVLVKFLGGVELHQDQADDLQRLMQSAIGIAGSFEKTAKEDTRKQIAELISLELDCLTGGIIEDVNMAEIEKAMWNVDTVRVKARLELAKGNYSQAGQLWQQISNYYKRSRNRNPEMRYRYYRARYYEVLCLSKLPNRYDEAAHTVEVMLSAKEKPDVFWREKLRTVLR